ncbi:hypothetical protein L226DRAFT_484485 [Lentinus tigrinus ALCF2SS1-7]|uniref:RING-type E3 ubiquitin transferase n=1 Tax=Lentinus tigrinus ALCF2SS1-6 TaxID=1328759 RepID=A0A5C2SMX6_9APHY|nr:hypothetical protein L227DRAFT_542369 [Lentinus tigrinus ALCF2SS1-6]RPD76650.1 hypothetical protein L226DRAFT_484485 [Lentinus tigrinus ALCF2SS1-7]
MQEEQDTCRICSAPAEPDQPLFHPCKCSGTIRYIHQDCLTEWLAHSRKKTCDVCKHPYSFTKVYSKDMPERLPILLVLRQFSQQVVSAILFGLRAALVGTVWLAALPWATIWTWRMYFALGNSAAWYISALKRPESDVDFYNVPATNATATNVTSSPNMDAQPLTLTYILAHPLYKAVSSDIFSGQIIASIIVLTFVAIFLLREWISQNARPGVFDDGDAAIDAAVPVPEALPPAVGDQPVPAPEPEPLLEVPAVLLPPTPPPIVAEPLHERAPPLRDHHYGGLRDDLAFQTRVKKPRTRRESPEPPILHIRGTRRPMSAREERKLRGHQVGRRRRIIDGEVSADENVALHEDKDFRRLRYVARRVSDLDDELRRQDGSSKVDAEVQWPPVRNPTFRAPSKLPVFSEFTFQAPGPAYPSSPTGKGKEPELPRTNFIIPAKENGHGEPSAQTSQNPFAPSRLRSGSEYDSDERDRTPTRPSTPVLDAMSTNSFSLSLGDTSATQSPFIPSPFAGTPSGLRRPPLPTVTLPPSPIPSTSGVLQQSRGQTPLASPSLATYRAPEEIRAGQPLADDYFVHGLDDIVNKDAMEAEQRRYFRDPDEETLAEEADGDDEEDGEDGEEEEEVWIDQQVEEQQRLARQAAGEVAAEMAEMADAEMDDEQEDIELQWTEEDEAAQEDEDEDDGGDDGEGIVQIREEAAAQPLAGGGAVAEAPAGPERRELRVVLGQPPEQVLPQDDLDQEVNIEDDMDGALEAIGLRGPLVGVLQNAVLMTFILDTTIGLGIWLPFTIGKTTALLTLNPRRALQLLHLPLRVIRLITDPMVDVALWLVSNVFLPLVGRASRLALMKVLGQAPTDKLTAASSSAYMRISEVANYIFERSPAATLSHADMPEAQPSSSYLYRVLEEDMTVMPLVEPYFATLGKNVREWSEEGKTSWIRFATGDTPNDRAFAVLLGYAVVGLLLAVYLNILTIGSMRSAGRAVRNAVRQQLLVVKVAAFIIIELVIFPLGCGVMLDVCTVWLFPQGSFRSRAGFLMYAPLTAVFYHWVLGTMFMYQFAVLLSGCRSIMRSGAMWFIKDPQDQNFHPIRDILERPTFVQIRKLVLSAMMYGFVVASGVATVSGILRIFSRTIMPFRWKIREPLSEVPIDLILLQLVLPYTVESFRPRKALRRFGSFIWKYLASRLRLSSYMFGGRFPPEEFTASHWSWRSLLYQDGMEMDDAEAVHDGCFRRVPNSDNVALVRDTPATAEVLEDGTPVDDRARKLIEVQDAETQKAKRLVKNDYAVVYIPPNFRYRVIVFLLCMWIIGSLLLATVLAAPILVGRGFFRLFIPREVHDGYSFIVGFHLLWGCWLVGSALDRMDKRRQRRWIDDENRAEWPIYVLKRSLLWMAQASYMALTLGIIIPTLVGLVFELYIVQPIRHTANPLVEPRIRMVDMWALGLLYSRIMIRSLRMRPPAQLRPGMVRGIDRIIRNGWTHLDPVRATKDVIGPLIAGLLGMIVLPAAILWGIMHFVTIPIDGDFLFLHVYPGIFTAAGLAHAMFAMSKVMGSWSQTIRDKEFLVEMRLRNLEPDSEKGKKTEQQMEVKGEIPTEVDE